MTTIKAIRLASLVTAINVLVASGFSIAAIIRPQVLVPAEPVRTQASCEHKLSNQPNYARTSLLRERNQ